MNVSLFMARRYIFSKKKRNFINVISTVAMGVVGLASMALIILLSVFNGLEGIIRGLYNDFDPDIQILSAEGKSFHYSDSLQFILQEIAGIDRVTGVIENNALIRYNGNERVVRVKGVEGNFVDNSKFSDNIRQGEFVLTKEGLNYALVGGGIQYDMGIKIPSAFQMLQFWFPKLITPSTTNPTKMVEVLYLQPSGIFQIEKYYDENYVIVPIEFASKLFGYGNRRNMLEITVEENRDIKDVQKQIYSSLGEKFIVKNGDQIHESIYKTLKVEKLFVYLILSMVIIIGSVNIYFVLTMLIIEKEKDISILKSIGASDKLIFQLFMKQGLLLGLFGAFLGLLIGVSISFVQEKFGIISMGIQNPLHSAYPVKLEFIDLILSVLIVLSVTFLASFLPAIKARKKFLVQGL